MSRLLDKLEQAMEGKAQPMGFAAAVARAKVRPMLILAQLPRLDPAPAQSAAAEKADGCLIPLELIRRNPEALESVLQALGEIPWGVALGSEASQETLAPLLEKGCDFAVVGDAAPAVALLQQEDLGYFMELDSSLPDSLARAIDRLPIDALLLREASLNITFRQLMTLQRLSLLTGRPLFIPPPMPLGKGEMEALWETGVRGIVVDLGQEDAQEQLRKVAQALDAMELPKKPHERRAALLPPTPEGWAEPEEEEDLAQDQAQDDQDSR